MAANIDLIVTQWFRDYGGLVRAVVRMFITESDEMEDLFQEVWIVVVKKFHDAPGDEKIRSWLYSITIMVCKGHMSKGKRRRNLFREWMSGQPPVEGGGPSPSIEEHFKAKELWLSVDQLPPLQRKVVLLRVVEELSTTEAAAELERAEGTVKASLHRAMKNLKKKICPPEEPPPASIPLPMHESVKS